MRTYYWGCSKFANWLRGTTYPPSATFKGWDEIHEEAKVAHPFRFWLADTLLDSIQNVIHYIPDKWDNLCCYLRNRVINRTHLLDTKLPPGQWQDTDTRILYGVMEALAYYVEVDCAAWTKKGTPREKGLKHLDWEITLTYDEDWMDEVIRGEPTDQAKSAMEVKELYLWWKDVRPNRPDPYDFIDEDIPNTDKDRFKEYTRMEQEYQDQDDAMLIRVIKARHGMWT